MQPIATVEMIRGALRLAAVCPQALKLGLSAGMTLADARAQMPDLALADHDPAADQRLLERLADGALRYTPMVALDGDDGLLLDIGGAAHLHGGEQALSVDAVLRLERLGLTVRMALADNPDAAHALARYSGGPAPDEVVAIRRLPIEALELDGEDAMGLRRAGLRRIADLADRPPAVIAARFGPAAVTALRRVMGRESRPIDPRQSAPALMIERRFADPVGRVDHMLGVLDELLGEASAQLAEKDRGGRAFEARFFRSDGLVFPLRVETGRATRDRSAIARLFAERVENLADPLDPGFGFDMLRLHVPRTEPLGAAQLLLENGDEVRQGQLDMLVDALSTRVGRARIQRIAPRDSHIPEQAQLLFPAMDEGPKQEWRVQEAGDPPLRPLHLFDPPQRIEVLAQVPEGPPRQFRWRRTLHQVARFEGPERIAPEWWHDGNAGMKTRDYFRVEDARGRRFWLFRHGLYGDGAASPAWYLHGLFA